MQLHVERVTKAIRRQRADAEKAAAEASHAAAQKASTGNAATPYGQLHIKPEVDYC